MDLIGCILEQQPVAAEVPDDPCQRSRNRKPLEGEIGFIRGGEKPVVGLDLKPKAPSTVFATFQCGKLPETGPAGTIEGSVIAPIKPLNRAVEEFTITYKALSGKQAVESFEGGPQPR